MKPPAFWSNPPDAPGLAARALAPLGWLTAAATARRVARPGGHGAGVPVICAGNLNVGGTGKTPTVIALIEALSARRVSAHVVTRGYGGRLAGPVRVDPRSHGAADVGDEPLLTAIFAPTWVARDRAEGVRAAEAGGAEAIVLDDGFQNPAVRRDLSIVVVDAGRGFGNGRCLPAGPLREPVAAGLARADLVLAIGDDAAQVRFDALWGGAVSVPMLRGRLVPVQTGMQWRDMPVMAFAGIGQPSKFFDTLRAEGARVLRTEPLDDHQPLSPTLMHRLEAEARALGAQLVTTEKDAARLPAEFRPRVLSLPVRLRLDDPGPLNAALDRLFG